MLSADISIETLQAKREWYDIFKMKKGKTYNQEYSTQGDSHSDLMCKSKKITLKNTYKQKLNEFSTTNELYNKC